MSARSKDGRLSIATCNSPTCIARAKGHIWGASRIFAFQGQFNYHILLVEGSEAVNNIPYMYVPFQKDVTDKMIQKNVSTYLT